MHWSFMQCATHYYPAQGATWRPAFVAPAKADEKGDDTTCLSNGTKCKERELGTAGAVS